MTHGSAIAAVDLGASSGRVMVGEVGPERLVLHEVHRFGNGPVQVGATLHWDILGLYRETLHGLRQACRNHDVASVGIDSWAVDYGLIDRTGALLGNPVHYRDRRTEGVMERVVKEIRAEELYAVTGVQQLPINTIYQLVAALGTPQLEAADQLLLVPDLLAYWLTGEVGAEATNASTTQLYDVRSGTWATHLADRLGIPTQLFPPLRSCGEVVGDILPSVATDLGIDKQIPVVAVGSHDTASSVVAVPAQGQDGFAYISSGTWSLVGMEVDAPVLTVEAREANFTNEGGVDGRIRLLRNVMGLWLVQESLRTWSIEGSSPDLPTLLREAAAARAFVSLIDPNDPTFVPPGDVPARILDFCVATGQPPPHRQADILRCILESLALTYRRTIRTVQQLAGRSVAVVHIVGGGARNHLLCQLTADACGLPVIAGPVEASALGNVLVQARTLGALLPDLESMRSLVRDTQHLIRYEPESAAAQWDSAESRLFGSTP